MDHKARMEAQQQAHNKLVEARRLINEAGALAKEFQFVLEFGEIGDFIPKRVFDKELYRDEAIECLQKEGWNYYDDERKQTFVRAWDSLTDEEKEEAIDCEIENIIDNLEIWDYKEYGRRDQGPDRWWHPSRC